MVSELPGEGALWTTLIEVFDPHFHIWDIRESVGHADPATLFAPAGTEHEGLYDATDLERDWAPLPAPFVHVGGVHVEAISCCFKGLSAQQLSPLCLREAEWVQAEIDKHFELACQDRLRRREYFQAASACLEDPEVAAVLQRLAANPKVRGVRQVLNVDPDWPRNGTNGLGELLDLPAWRAGYAQLAGVGFSFDMQLNPHQFQKGAALAASHPAVPVIINHMGTPRLQDLQDGGGLFWEGMEALAAAGPHVFLQVSMLGYADPKWDENELVTAAVARAIQLFGPERCFFASNYPVDLLPAHGAWTPERLYPAFLKVAQAAGCDGAAIRRMFNQNARAAYRV